MTFQVIFTAWVVTSGLDVTIRALIFSILNGIIFSHHVLKVPGLFTACMYIAQPIQNCTYKVRQKTNP